jgi:hypothetical protein
MVSALATVAFQTMANEMNGQIDTVQPSHLDRCHALRTNGSVVELYYPKWFKKI